MLKLIAGPICNFSAKVRLAISEKGLTVETEEVPYTLQQGYFPKHPDVLAISPTGSVPVLVTDGLALYDSTVIIEYLEDRYPEPALYPRPAELRARCRQLEAEADELLWPRVRALRNAVSAQDVAVITTGRRDVQAFYLRLERQLPEHGYLCGEFSAADIATWILVHLSAGIDAAPDDACPKTARWYRLVSERPAFERLIAQRRAALQRLGAQPDPGRAAPICSTRA